MLFAVIRNVTATACFTMVSDLFSISSPWMDFEDITRVRKKHATAVPNLTSGVASHLILNGHYSVRDGGKAIDMEAIGKGLILT